MYLLNAGNIKLEIGNLTAVITLNKSDRAKFLSDIDDLNESGGKAFSLGIYEFNIVTISTTINTRIPSEEVKDTLASHNIFLPLLKNREEQNLYACGNIDFSKDKEVWLRQIHEFMVEAAKYNIATLQNKIKYEITTIGAGYIGRISSTLIVLDRFDKAIPQAIGQIDEYIKSVCGTKAAKVTISIKEISVLRYRRETTLYGIEIGVNDTKIPIHLGDKTQTILYIAALIRFKMGQPLYLHELYRNSRGSQSIYKREKTYNWFSQIFDVIFGKTAIFNDWANPARKDKPQPRSGHDFNQAKSALFDKLKKKLGSEMEFALDYCCLHDACDANNDTYYTFHCSPEDIILDETAQKLSALFKKHYPARY